MKLPLSWLKEYTNIDGITNAEYCSKLTMSGSKVECIEYLGREINNVVTGQILSVRKHENSDHLVICQINVNKDEPIQIVTGAPNVTEKSIGQICPVCLHKSTLPNGVKITKGKLRGVESNGMLCSFEELGLDHSSVPYASKNGILFLPQDTPIGVDIKTVVGLDEYVAEFEITSNRPDCMSVIGIARETAATFNRPFNINQPSVKSCEDDIAKYISVAVEEPRLCQRYTARIVKNIKIEPSPSWLRERLFAAGVRPINNIVDITNYVMLEYGQPMHAFDYSCISDNKIVVRRAKDNETIKTLDGQNRKMTNEMLAICDGQKPIAVAGVMGGANSEIKETTKTIVFESACFESSTIRHTAKTLGMRTESSSRFEKGLDPTLSLNALERACELIEMLNAGEVVNGIVDVCYTELVPKIIDFEPNKINTLLGTNLSYDEQKSYLERLDFKINGNKITIPTFRVDIEHMCDIAEEVARIYGYNNIPTRLYTGETTHGGLSKKQNFERIIKNICLSAGFDEAITHSFISPKFYENINLSPNDKRTISTKILNPLGEDFSIMRTTVLPSILQALEHNNAHRNPSASLFEIGTVYNPIIKEDNTVDCEKLPNEEKILTIGTYGKFNFFQIKGLVETICSKLNIANLEFIADTKNPSYHTGRCAKIISNEKIIGAFGTIHPVVSKKYGFNCEVLVCEININTLFSCSNNTKLYKPLSKFPSSTRDIAVVVDDCITSADMQNVIKIAAGGILESVKLFDVYKGNNIAEGKKSMAYSMTLRADDRTLKDEECDEVMYKAIKALEEKFGAILRS